MMKTMKEIADEMRDPLHTCSRCEFSVCPMLNHFACEIESASAPARDPVSLELYRCLREAAAEMCRSTCGSDVGECKKPYDDCRVKRWIRALKSANENLEAL